MTRNATSTDNKSRRTCVMLWGPDNSHKAAQSELLVRKLNALHLSTKNVYQFVWRYIYPEQFERIQRIPDHNTKVEKTEQLYDMTIAHTLGATAHDYCDGTHGINEAAFLFMKDLLRSVHGITLTWDIWLRFTEQAAPLSQQRTICFYKDFVVWYAKAANRNLVIDSEGYSFNPKRLRSGFKGSDATLHIVYSDYLNMRARSPKPATHASPMHKVYGCHLQSAVRSGLFSTIVVSDQTSKHASLQWLRFKRTPNGYHCAFQDESVEMTPSRYGFCKGMFAGQLA